MLQRYTHRGAGQETRQLWCKDAEVQELEQLLRQIARFLDPSQVIEFETAAHLVRLVRDMLGDM